MPERDQQGQASETVSKTVGETLTVRLLRRLAERGVEGASSAADTLARARSIPIGPGMSYSEIKLEDSRRVSQLLDRQGNQALYRELRALGVAEENLAGTLLSSGARLSEMPIQEGQELQGYTAFAEYFATGEGLHLWWLFDPSFTSPEQAREAWLARFFDGDPSGEYFSRGLLLIHGEYHPGLRPSDGQPLEVHQEGLQRWWKWERNYS